MALPEAGQVWTHFGSRLRLKQRVAYREGLDGSAAMAWLVDEVEPDLDVPEGDRCGFIAELGLLRDGELVDA